MAEKVLVVDDERQIRDLLGEFLEQEGYEVLLASAGEEAIDLAERKIPHAILLDVKMPSIDGIEVCKKLKAAPRTQFIPVIMITAHVDNKMVAIESGADDFVSKPIDLVELGVRVKSILRIRYLTDELERAVTYIEELQKKQPELR